MPRRGGGHPERRGQVILVAAIGIALTLITMGMVLNAAAIPEQWWSSENVDSVDSVQGVNSVVEGYGSALFYANFDNQFGYSELADEFSENGLFWLQRFARMQNAEGQTANTTLLETTNGTIIMQKHRRSFTSKSGAPSWTVVEHAKVRRFEMNITRVNETGSPFRVVLKNNSTKSTVRISRTPADEIRIQVDGHNRTYDQSSIVADFTEHTIGKNETPWFPGVSPPYESVRFESADTAVGRYLLITNRTESFDNGAGDERYHELCGVKSPCTEHAIYSGIVRYTFESSTVTYRSNLTIAPEDPGLVFPDYNVHHRVVFYDASNGKKNLSSVENTSGPIRRHVREMAPAVFGPAQYDLTASGGVDIPFISNSALRLVDTETTDVQREETLLLQPNSASVKDELIGVGDYDQDGYPEIYYNQKDDIYKINAIPADDEDYLNKTFVRDGELLGGDAAVRGIVDVSDLDGNGEPELVVTTKGSGIMYLDRGKNATLVLEDMAQAESVGSPADFDKDGIPRIPVVKQNDGRHIYLVNASGNKTMVAKSPNVSPQPLAPADIDEDGQLDIVYANQNDLLAYVPVNESKSPDNVVPKLVEISGDEVVAEKEKGVR